jgi:hypothetical protein
LGSCTIKTFGVSVKGLGRGGVKRQQVANRKIDLRDFFDVEKIT